jgi:sulfur-oxidizing protein SoxY
LGLLALGGVRPATAQEPAQLWQDAVKAILGSAKPTLVKGMLDMPELAENGNTVPFTVIVDSPMTEEDNVKAVHIIATANPQPGVATFHFTLLSGKASVAGRMRLAATQDIICIAELGGTRAGNFLMAKRTVKVTIGGCGG